MKDNQKVTLFINTATKALELGATVSTRYLTVDMGDPKRALERTHLGIEYLGDRLHFSLADVDAFYCLLGPGSNTGIRLGLAIPRTIYGINDKIKIYGIATMKLMLQEKKNAISCLSDRSGNLFAGENKAGVYSYRKILRADVSKELADYPEVIVEKKDELAHLFLKGKSLKEVDILDLMMNSLSLFTDFSSKEEEYLPEYALKI